MGPELTAQNCHTQGLEQWRTPREVAQPVRPSHQAQMLTPKGQPGAMAPRPAGALGQAEEGLKGVTESTMHLGTGHWGPGGVGWSGGGGQGHLAGVVCLPDEADCGQDPRPRPLSTVQGLGQGSRGPSEGSAQAHPESQGEVIPVVLTWPQWGAPSVPPCWHFWLRLMCCRGSCWEQS